MTVLTTVSKGHQCDINRALRFPRFFHRQQRGLTVGFCMARARLSSGTNMIFQLPNSAFEGQSAPFLRKTVDCH